MEDVKNTGNIWRGESWQLASEKRNLGEETISQRCSSEIQSVPSPFIPQYIFITRFFIMNKNTVFCVSWCQEKEQK